MGKEKQPLVDPEQGRELRILFDNEPRDLIVLDGTKENAPKHKTAREARSSTTSKPERSESEIPGLWASTFSREHCCIYKVPNALRIVKPEAYHSPFFDSKYIPRMLLIGPLHHSKKADALNLPKTDSRYLEYIKMEAHKKNYLRRVKENYGDQTIHEFRTIIERDEKVIRNNYLESTDWIKSKEFVEMILLDSVFILVLFIQLVAGTRYITVEGDILFEELCLLNTIFEDLILLENQLPYSLLEKLFDPFFVKFKIRETLHDITLQAFGFKGKIEREKSFRHFTDLLRLVRVETLGLTKEEEEEDILVMEYLEGIHNAETLDSERVDFAILDNENDLSLVIEFTGRLLKMPYFIAEDSNERRMRNIIALEQCHYHGSAFVCNYISFLNFLIETEKDVDVLVKKGIVKNWLGRQDLVVEMVKKMNTGVVDFGSYYFPISVAINRRNESRLNIPYKYYLNKSIATLKRVYFKDVWTGTATMAAVVLLVLAFLQTVASFIQVEQNAKKPAPPPAPIGKP